MTEGSDTFRLPALARGFIAATFAVALALTGFLLVTRGVEPRALVPLAFLLPAIVVLERASFRSPAGALITPGDPFMLAAALLVSPAALCLMALPSLLTTPTPPPYARERRIFNFGADTLMLLAAAGAEHVLELLPVAGGLRHVLVALAAGTAYRLANALLTGTCMELCGRHGAMREFFSPRDALIAVGYASIAVTAALVYDQHLPALALFGFAPLLFIWDAARVPHLEAEARIDGKTGLLTPRALRDRLDEEFAGDGGRRGALLMADLDLLRDVNNTHGHLAGDAVLRTVGETILTTLHANDVAGRFGGEEFCILLPGADGGEAAAVAERLRDAVEQLAVLVDGLAVRITISIGLTLYPQAGAGCDELIAKADAALYEAKGAGRNQVRLAA